MESKSDATVYVNKQINLKFFDADTKNMIEEDAKKSMNFEHFSLVKCFDVRKTQDSKLNVISEYV